MIFDRNKKLVIIASIVLVIVLTSVYVVYFLPNPTPTTTTTSSSTSSSSTSTTTTTTSTTSPSSTSTATSSTSTTTTTSTSPQSTTTSSTSTTTPTSTSSTSTMTSTTTSTKTTTATPPPFMKFTLIALNGTELTVDSDMLATLPSVTYLGGLKTSAGYIRDVSNYTGVLVTVLADWVGGLDNGTSLYVTAVDGYSMVFSYTQITGDFVTFDPVTGDEVEHKEPLYMVLAYLKNGEPLPEGEGPLRLMVLGPEGLVTEGHNWVKLVNIVEIRPATREWTLTLDGFLTEEVDRATFESGVNCHSANWTDSEGKTWTGIPLWLLVGRVDDGNVHETNDTYKAFNRTLADIGYRVRLTATDGYKVELNSSFVKLNNGIIVASLLDGKVLPDPYWPLKLVGPSLPKNQMIASIVKIEVIFGNDWNITLKGALTELMTRDIFDEGTDCHQANWTDSENRTWTGIPLWLLVGRVDDALQHGENAFNRTLADQGYIVRIRAADGFTVDFNSTELKLNDNIIIANMMNGMPLPEKYWPLRSVGPSLTKKQMVNNIVEIEIIFPS